MRISGIREDVRRDVTTSLAYGGKSGGKLRNEILEALPEGGERVSFALVQREHGVVVNPCFVDVRQL